MKLTDAVGCDPSDHSGGHWNSLANKRLITTQAHGLHWLSLATGPPPPPTEWLSVTVGYLSKTLSSLFEDAHQEVDASFKFICFILKSRVVRGGVPRNASLTATAISLPSPWIYGLSCPAVSPLWWIWGNNHMAAWLKAQNRRVWRLYRWNSRNPIENGHKTLEKQKHFST